MAGWRIWCSALLILLSPGAIAETQIQPSDDEPAPVAFKIVASPNEKAASPDVRTFAASYGTGEGQGRFLIELDAKRIKGVSDVGGEAGLDITFSSGRFRHVSGSNPGPFLDALATALEARAPKRSQQRLAVVAFDVAILDAHAGRAANGGFTGGSGDWVATKLFLADGEAEVFFNFNSVSGDAEFSLKDTAYGNLVVEELSKVLW